MASGAPDLLGPLRGWRAWTVRRTDDGWRLASIHYREVWPAGNELAAWCFRSTHLAAVQGIGHERHLAPVAGCHCGIYGADGREHAAEYLIPEHAGWETMYTASTYLHRVLGQIDLWGRTVECEHGYRASYGYPARLWVPTRRPDGAELDVGAIALDLLDYGVPVDLVDAGPREEILDRVAAVSS